MAKYVILCTRHDPEGAERYYLDASGESFNMDEFDQIKPRNYFKNHEAVAESIWDYENRNALDQARMLPGTVPWVEFAPCEIGGY